MTKFVVLSGGKTNGGLACIFSFIFFFLHSPIVLLIKVASVRALPIEPEAMLADAPRSRRNFSDSTA